MNQQSTLNSFIAQVFQTEVVFSSFKFHHLPLTLKAFYCIMQTLPYGSRVTKYVMNLYPQRVTVKQKYNHQITALTSVPSNKLAADMLLSAGTSIFEF